MAQTNQQKQITEFLIEFKSRFTQAPQSSFNNCLVGYSTKINRQDVSSNLQMYLPNYNIHTHTHL
jgi:hypothetical protein